MFARFRRGSDGGTAVGQPSPEFLAVGETLLVELEHSLSAYIERLVLGRLEVIRAPSVRDRELVIAGARKSAADVNQQLARFVRLDVDAQQTTPLSIVCGFVAPITALCEQLEIVPVERDRFLRERFPEDRYDLTPPNLAAVGEGVGEAALVWGAAKAFEHRRRHREAQH